jgi:hypothetical protein
MRRTPEIDALADADTGRLTVRVPLDSLWIPGAVSTKAGVLSFDWRVGYSWLKVPPTLLDQFIAISSDDNVLLFARRYGPLGLSAPGQRAGSVPLFGRRAVRRELLAWWRRAQSEFRLLLTLAALLREGSEPRREIFAQYEEWGIIVPARTLGNIGRPSSILNKWSEWPRGVRKRAATELLEMRMRSFVQQCGLRPALMLEPTKGSFKVGFHFQDATANSPVLVGLSLFGALTVQLLATVAGSGVAVCSGCGNVFVPRGRRPGFGKRRYCPRCGRRAAVRDAKADYRRRLREENAQD